MIDQRQLLRAEARHILPVRAAPGRLGHRPALRRRLRNAVRRARAPGRGHHVLRDAGLPGRGSRREKEVGAGWVDFYEKQDKCGGRESDKICMGAKSKNMNIIAEARRGKKTPLSAAAFVRQVVQQVPEALARI